VLWINKRKIFEIGTWTAYEIKVALLRMKPEDNWNIGVLHAKLLDSEERSYQVLYDHECLKLIRKVLDISSLDSLLSRVARGESLNFDKEEASFEFISSNLKLGFKDRQYMFTTYLSDNPCYLLDGGPTNESKFRTIENVLRVKLPRHAQPKESLNEACKSMLNISLGGAYHPHIRVYTPIFLKLQSIEFKNRRVFVYLYCHKRIEKNNVKLNLHGKDDLGEGTFDKQITGFKSKKRTHDIIYSSSRLEANSTTQDLKLVLY
jgi:hypothetical protein